MKNKIFIYILIISLFSSNSWTQSNSVSLSEKKPKKTNTNSKVMNSKVNIPKKIKYYHVEETTTLKFGGYKTVYDVTDPKMINTDDLGPNGLRTITPVYEDKVQLELQETTLKSDTSIRKKVNSTAILITDKPKKKDSYAYIDIIKTYERVADKGYESIDMLKKMGNSYFFDDELEKAEKCYNKLFSLTTDLEPEYYYRYSIALRAMGKIEMSNEFLKKFNELSNTTRK